VMGVHLERIHVRASVFDDTDDAIDAPIDQRLERTLVSGVQSSRHVITVHTQVKLSWTALQSESTQELSHTIARRWVPRDQKHDIVSQAPIENRSCPRAKLIWQPIGIHRLHIAAQAGMYARTSFEECTKLKVGFVMDSRDVSHTYGWVASSPSPSLAPRQTGQVDRGTHHPQ
jgi:hypothetical protein